MSHFSQQIIEFKKNQEPDWLFNFRIKSLEKLNQIEIPKNSMESWRRVPLSNFHPENFYNDIINISSDLEISEKSNLKFFSELSGADLEFVKTSLYTLLEKYSNSYFALSNFALFETGAFISFSDNSSFKDMPYCSLNYKSSNGSKISSPLYIIKSGKFSSIKLSKNEISPKSEDLNLFNSFTGLFLEESAKIQFVEIEDFTENTFHFSTTFISQKKDSALYSHYYNLGGYRGKSFHDTELSGEGASSELMGASVVARREIQDVEYNVKHLAGKTDSSLKFRVVARDKSHHVFTGTLNIPKTALNVHAAQSNNNLLLHKTARAESMPKLEVFAEDVQCSHGATVGEVDEEEMFYLLTRGISEAEARILIVEGFLSEILDKTENEEIKTDLWKIFQSKILT